MGKEDIGHFKEVAWSYCNKLMEGLRLGLRTFEQGFRMKEERLQFYCFGRWEVKRGNSAVIPRQRIESRCWSQTDLNLGSPICLASCATWAHYIIFLSLSFLRWKIMIILYCVFVKIKWVSSCRFLDMICLERGSTSWKHAKKWGGRSLWSLLFPACFFKSYWIRRDCIRFFYSNNEFAAQIPRFSMGNVVPGPR